MTDATIISASASMRAALELAARFAPRATPILIVGPTGSGKEVVASAIHRLSGRPGSLVEINCGALPRELIEAQLFGHRRGAFSGALADAPGHIESAGHGTLFLDELASMPVDAQVKLLKVLEEGWVMRVGESRPRAVDVRFVAAVQAMNAREIDRRLLRFDLLHRLSGVVIELQSLSERPEDVMALAEHFAARVGQALDRSCQGALLNHLWPGNVRELRHTIERAAVLSSNRRLFGVDIVRAIDLGLPVGGLGGPASDADRERVIQTLAVAGWNVIRAAGLLGVGRATLFRRLRGWGLSVAAVRASHESRYGIETRETVSALNAPSAPVSG